MVVCVCMQVMWSMSDKSDEVCERIIKVGLHADMLQTLSWDTLSAAILNKAESSSKRSVVESQNGTLHNVVRRRPEARGAFRKCQAVNVVQKFRDVTEYPVILCFFLVYYAGP